MKKTKQKWCLRILVWLVALLVLLGVADSCRVQEDPHRTLVQGSLQELNDSWTLETDQQAVYDIPESMGESLMLSIRIRKILKRNEGIWFSASGCGRRTVRRRGSIPMTRTAARQRCGSLLLCRRARPERRWYSAVRSRRPSARC